MTEPGASDGGEPTPDGGPRRLFSATPTRLTTWVDCPWRYRFTYLDRRPKGAPWAHSSVGAAAHNALRDWWSEPLQRRTPAAAADLVRADWLADGFRDEHQSQQWQARTAAAVQAYAAGLDPADEPVGVERTVADKTDRLALSGRVDRIDLRPSADGGTELVVVDYKTGRRPSTVDDARSSLALAVYVAAARRTLRQRCRRVELHHLPSGEVAAYEHSEQSLARHLARADDIGGEAARAGQQWRDSLADRADDAAAGDADAIDAVDAVFPARPASSCAWCDFRAACPEGEQASDALQPWAGLGADEPAEPTGP